MSDTSFEKRKQDHIRLALDPKNEAKGGSGLDRIELRHEALPELDFKDINLDTTILGRFVSSPFFISSMTAGHSESEGLNTVMARACEMRGWVMGVGSQRKQLGDSDASSEWLKIRKIAPNVQLMGNIGLSQLIASTTDDVKRLADSVNAIAMIVHTNPLQEVLQPEGTPSFKGGLRALERLSKELKIPIVLKETGCGFSEDTLKRLNNIGLAAVDVSGFGGTHWGRLEGQRSNQDDIRAITSESFRDWGHSTVDSLRAATSLNPNFEVWASGGVRSGLDAAKLLSLGAQAIGIAKPIIESALKGVEALSKTMETFEFELKTALFCTGTLRVKELRYRNLWRIKDGPSA